jgi:PAS domain S-box-containing protein
MKATNHLLTHHERRFAADDVIVTKTNLKGHITYANRVFLELSGLELDTAVGAAHSVIRHPDMPRCVFKLLWDRLQAGREVFAYIVNRSTNGDHYWVFAHVTPSFGSGGKVVGYHSNRRLPKRETLDQVIQPLYKDLLVEESRHENRKEGMNRAFDLLMAKLKERGLDYDEFIFSI